MKDLYYLDMEPFATMSTIQVSGLSYMNFVGIQNAAILLLLWKNIPWEHVFLAEVPEYLD
jgi:hypothetical protein